MGQALEAWICRKAAQHRHERKKILSKFSEKKERKLFDGIDSPAPLSKKLVLN
jgi:hypothetical protein